MTFSHFSKGFIRPNLGEEIGCGLGSGFKFQVLRFFVPQSQGDEEQSSGGGMFPRSSAPRSFLQTPSASLVPLT